MWNFWRFSSPKRRERSDSLFQLYLSFFRVGLFTIGGAYAMLPVADRVLSGIYTKVQIVEAYAVAQTVPGVIAANTSAILGNQKRGVLGAVSAVLGVITPSVIIIGVIAAILTEVRNPEWLNKAFMGIRIAVLALLIKSAYEMWKKSIVGIWSVAVLLTTLSLVFFRVVSAPLAVALAALLGFAGSYVSCFSPPAKKSDCATERNEDRSETENPQVKAG